MEQRILYGSTRPALAAVANDYEPGLVTVVIPCFNAAPYVGAAIKSALNQTYDRVEVVVIDDGSTDDSLAVVRSYDSRITFLAKANAGACAARNDGLQLAKGEFVQFLDADDWLEPDAIANRISSFTGDEGLVFGDRIHVSDDGQLLTDYSSAHPTRGWESDDWIHYVLITNIHTMEPLHRKEWACRVGGFDESFPQSQEPDFHLRLLLAGCNFAYSPGVVGAFRQHASGSRVSSAQWWSTDPDRYLRIVAHWGTLVSERSDALMQQEFQKAGAILLCYRAIQVASYGDTSLARRYHDEVLRLDPGYRPKGLTGAATSIVGLWTAIRVAGWLRRVSARS